MKKRILQRTESDEEGEAKRARLETPPVLDIIEEEVIPEPSAAAASQTQKAAYFVKGTIEDMIFFTNEDIKSSDITNLFIHIKDLKTVWLRHTQDLTLGQLLDHLLQLYPECSLVTPTFSANNEVRHLSKSNVLFFRQLWRVIFLENYGIALNVCPWE